MTRRIKYSIGIPTFKSQFLHECISSILNQSFSDLELIIINDCSPHPIDEVIGQFNDIRIRYYKNTINEGAQNVVNNFNKCLEKANGEFFVLMGDDDKLEVNYLEEFNNLIFRFPGLDIYHCRSKIIDENSQPIIYTPSWPEYESLYDNIWHRINFYRIQYISDFLYRTDSLRNRGGFFNLPLAWMSDDITSYIAMNGKGVAHTNIPLFNYRMNNHSISLSGSVYLKMDAIKLANLWLKNFLLSEPFLYEDKIIYKNLFFAIEKYIKLRKISTISQSYNAGLFLHFIYWYIHKRKYNIKMIELIYSVIEYFKQKKVKTIINVNSYN